MPLLVAALFFATAFPVLSRTSRTIGTVSRSASAHVQAGWRTMRSSRIPSCIGNTISRCFRSSRNGLWALRVSSEGNPIDAAPHFIGTLDSPALSIAQFAPPQLAMITTEGIEFADQRLMLRYALAPRPRPAKHR